MVAVELVEVEGEGDDGDEVVPVEAVLVVRLASLLPSLPPSGSFTLPAGPVLLVVLLPGSAGAVKPVPPAVPAAVPVVPE